MLLLCVCLKPFEIQMPAELSKNGKGTLVPLTHPTLNNAYAFYLESIRPSLVKPIVNVQDGSEVDSGYVFLKRDGQSPRSDFSDWAKEITQLFIGRQVNAHAFRHGLITTYYQASATQSEMGKFKHQ